MVNIDSFISEYVTNRTKSMFIKDKGLYGFYCLRYLYYEWAVDMFKDFFSDFPCLQINRLVAESIDKELGTWLYEEFMKEWTVEKHQKIVDGIEAVLQKA